MICMPPAELYQNDEPREIRGVHHFGEGNWQCTINMVLLLNRRYIYYTSTLHLSMFQ
jgi:hypothetical protein